MADNDPGMGSAGKPAAVLAEPVMMATAGATGKEKTAKRKKSSREKKSRNKENRPPKHAKKSRRRRIGHHRGPKESHSRHGRGGSKQSSNVVAVPPAPPLFDDAPLTQETNMAGFADTQARTVLGVANRTVKVGLPSNQNRLTHESFIHFKIRSTNEEHIRFRPDLLTLVIYATYKNKDGDSAKSQTAELTASRWALRARDQKPFMYLDPSVGATGFFYKVDTLIDNVPVGSNDCVGNLLLQYTRCCEVFHSKAKNYFRTSADLKVDMIKSLDGGALQAAVAPFHYGDWNSTRGVRIEAKLRGTFPFDFKNETAAAADNLREPNYYFPPGTTFDFRFHYHPDKFAAVFHPKIAESVDEYNALRGTDPGLGVSDYQELDIRYQIVEASLEYDVIQLRHAQQIEYLEKMRHNGLATYRYDVPRGQHVSLPAKQTYVDLPFTIAPWARMMYVMFLKDWATFSMPNTRRPLSGWSVFPEGCTSLKLVYGGDADLITSHLDRLGYPGEQIQHGKRVLYNYVTHHRFFNGKFEDLFPADAGTVPLNQVLVADLREQMSSRAETLNVRCSFSDGKTSPENTQVVVLTVHSTGEVTCSHGGGSSHYDWRWEVKY